MDLLSLMTPGSDAEIIVAKSEVDAIKELIKEQVAAGKHWVVFPDGVSLIGSHDLNFFSYKLDVAEFIHENATDQDHYCDLSIADFSDRLMNWEKIQNNGDALLGYLEEKMKNADWHYKEADHYERFYKGEKELGQINYLLLLAAKEKGVEEVLRLWKTHVPDHTVPKPDFLNKKNIVMTEQEMMHAKKQYGKIGITDGFDDEKLITRMRNGEPVIEHHYQKTFTIMAGRGDDKNLLHQDVSNATLHWKKLNDSNLYFLNKWDLSVKPDGKDKKVKMTFYINDPKRMAHVIKNPNQFLKTFTFKSSVNYLCGRPVLNNYVNQNGDQFKAWDKAYPEQTLPNGRMKERTFHENYGFDLRQVAANYKVNDLANTEYANRLYENLERGNLQLATFTGKDGQQASLFITPNIQVGCFDVLTLDKKPVSLDVQVEKGYITQDFKEKVQERLQQIQAEKNGIKQGHETKKETLQSGSDTAQQTKQEAVSSHGDEGNTKQKGPRHKKQNGETSEKKQGQSQTRKRRQKLS